MPGVQSPHGPSYQVKSPTRDAGLEIDMAAKADVIEDGHSTKDLHLLKGPGNA